MLRDGASSSRATSCTHRLIFGCFSHNDAKTKPPALWVASQT